MLELVGIVPVRRPDGSRWKDESLFRFAAYLADAETGYRGTEEASVEDIQSYSAFQRFVAREFGVWFRHSPAELVDSGHQAWNDLLSSVWGRDGGAAFEGSEETAEPASDASEPPSDNPWSLP